MATLYIAIFLFSYANSTMFWHVHMVANHYWIFHSHIAGSTHRSAPIEKAHTSEELLLIQSLNQVSLTDDVISYCEIEPFCELVETIITVPEYTCNVHYYERIVLRGPPSLA